MTSIRTQYRQKRQQIIIECIDALIQMLLLEKQEQERIKLPFFKRLKKTIEKRNFDEKQVN